MISAKPGLNRCLRAAPGGLLRIDAARAKAEENLDGKYLLCTSEPKMSAEDIALGCKQLRRQLGRIAADTFTGPAGTFRQRTEISPAQATILEQLGIDPPPKIYQLTPTASG